MLVPILTFALNEDEFSEMDAPTIPVNVISATATTAIFDLIVILLL